MLTLALQLALAQVFVPSSPWEAIAGAADGTLVVCRADEARVSRDQGASFTPLAAGKIDALSIDAGGRIYLVHDADRLSIIARDGSVRESRIPGVSRTDRMFVRDGRIVWVGARGGADEDERLFMVSRDDGRTFTPRPEWPLGNEAAEVAIDAKGHIQLLTGWEAGCGGGYQSRYIGTLSGRTLTEAPWPLDAPVDQIVSPSGWIYAPDDCGSQVHGICAVGPREGQQQLLALPITADAWPYLRGVSEGERTWLLAGGKLAVATGASARMLANEVPAETSELAVAGGHPWVLGPRGLFTLDETSARTAAWRAVALD